MRNIDNFKVTKRDDSVVPLDISKINQVVEWACHDIKGVSASDIIMNANIEFYDKMSTSDIHDILIDSTARLIKSNTNMQYVASRLMTFNMRKNIYGRYQPDTLYDIVKRNIKLGLYNEIILKKYTRKEFDFYNSEINHNNDFKFTHAGLKQFADKYLIQDRSIDKLFETPQILMMLVPMYAFRNYKGEQREKLVLDFYDSLNRHEINLPTPVLGGLRSPKEQFSSCTVISAGDSIDAISAADDAILKYTASRAGIGLEVGGIRPLGSKIRSGEVVHTGIIPFLKKFHATNKSCTQNGIRGGAMTVFLPWWHPEIEEFIVIKNDKGSNDARIPGIDPSIQMDGLFIDRAIKNKSITLVSPHDFPEVYNTFGLPEFKENYLAAEKLVKENPENYNTARKINARDLLVNCASEQFETGRLYIHFIDNANKYTPYLEKIKQSNLCMEIQIISVPLKYINDEEGVVNLCTLAAVNWVNTSLDRMEKVTDLIIRFLDEILDFQDYPLKSAENATKAYRPLGVGISSFADWMAVRKMKFSFGEFDPSVYDKVHEWAEAQNYYLLKASANLAIEKGSFDYIERTKWKDGVLPIDYKNTTRDSFTEDIELRCDWESLRKMILETGIRHSVVGANMPAESSSVIWNISNGLEPIRDVIVEKTSGTNSITQVAKYAQKHSKFYQTPWEHDWSNIEFLKILSIIQKFTDQGSSINVYSSGNHYEDGKIKLQDAINEIIMMHKLGHKSMYYRNIDDGSGEEDESGCGSGGCTL